MTSYKELISWQKAIELTESIYSQTNKFPKEEAYGLTSQMRRAAVSIPSNIAEGQGRESDIEFIRFLTIARGSLFELETQLTISKKLSYISQDEADKIDKTIEAIGKLINGLIRSLKKNPQSNR